MKIKKTNNKKIYIEYLQIDSEIYERNKMRVAKNFPKYDDFKYVYLYELLAHEFLDEKIKSSLIQDISEHQFYDSFFITLTDDELGEIEYIFDDEFESDLNKENWELDYSMVNLAISALKQDPKFWDV